jgi:hypothetical protein
MSGMKDQLGETFFEHAYARRTDLPTSHAAARRVNDKVPELEQQVYEVIKSQGDRGATWNEIASLSGIDKGSISPRFKPLRKREMIKAKVHGDDVVKREHQTVWVAV